MSEQSINIERLEHLLTLFGNFDSNIKFIEKECDVSILCRGSEIKVQGEAENVSRAVRVISCLLVYVEKGEALTDQNINYVISLVDEGNDDKIFSLSDSCICISSKGRPVRAKTLGQQKYVDAIEKNIPT